MSRCKECGFEAGFLNLKNGLCKTCSTKNIDVIDSKTQKKQAVATEKRKRDDYWWLTLVSYLFPVIVFVIFMYLPFNGAYLGISLGYATTISIILSIYAWIRRLVLGLESPFNAIKPALIYSLVIIVYVSFSLNTWSFRVVH